jgi:hypothetical protein
MLMLYRRIFPILGEFASTQQNEKYFLDFFAKKSPKLEKKNLLVRHMHFIGSFSIKNTSPNTLSPLYESELCFLPSSLDWSALAIRALRGCFFCFLGD